MTLRWQVIVGTVALVVYLGAGLFLLAMGWIV
jgi:hypothetical protein